MLLTRDEIRFDFGGAEFDVERDRQALTWVFSQFLYGEVTGIQVGHWIYNAPDFDSAQFLVRQCAQELSHVRLLRRIFDRLETQPQPAHRLVKFLSTGLMGASWEEHVCLEMALGEGYVLTVFYALIDTVPDPLIRRLLETAARQEETHVAFGEEQTMRAGRDPRRRRHLLGMSLVSLFAMRRLAGAMARRMQPQHPVWRQLPAFARHTAELSELRLQRMGLLEEPLQAMSPVARTRLMTAGLLARAMAPLRFKRRRLTGTYLQDRAIANPALPPA
ncbi:MAG: ferritin-like domain-containing protein [Candidatus Latescibacterota bacterium]|nr:MAG: ferritin-like domain-containing protein [Candidatus Latescibacterota bacterium]